MSPRRLPRSANLIEAFLDMMSAERGAGANTLAAYGRDLAEFAGHADPAQASRTQIQDFLAGLAVTTAPSTQARKLSALRQFYGFLYAEGLRDDNPTLTLAAPKPRRPLPKILSGAVGGLAGGQILGSLMGDPATAGALGGMLGDAVGGVGGGAILTAIVGAVMGAMKKA